MIRLDSNINLIKGIGAKKAERLNTMGIYTVFDMLDHFPIRYKDKRRVIDSNKVNNLNIAQVQGTLLRINSRPLSGGKTVTECQFEDNGGKFTASFFNMPYLKQSLNIGTEYVLYGQMRLRNDYRVWTNPEILEAGSEKDIRGIIPVYRCTQGITNNDFIKWIRCIFDECDLNIDWVDSKIIKNNKLCDRNFAYKNIHFPDSEKHYQAARFRIIYDQLLIYQLAIRLNRKKLEDDSIDASINDIDISPLVARLPFKLTEGQDKCIREIEQDLISKQAMNRLIQGDVGCGKTVIAEAAIYKCIKSGYQAALMAPTEILARQHYERLSSELGECGINASLLVSGMRSADRRTVLDDVKSGKINLVVGTHAIIQDDVSFDNLGLVVTDEQHRFGVNQRKSIVNKGRGVNVCVMSATPIPRTLAATVYGDMDFSVVKSKPANRLEIITKACDESSRERAYISVREQIKAGHQAYVIAPSISSEDEEISSVESLCDELKNKFSEYRVELLHGKLSKNDKDSIMQCFAEGKINILVSTTVIEVGIDVPNATIIVIENCERFGLAQMHQLRGRVGRSKYQSYCYLINYSNSENAALRADAMVKISDGFEIAEADYKLRGPGDIMGTMQSGNFQSNIINLSSYSNILELAIKDANNIIDKPDDTNLSYVYEYISCKDKTDYSNII